MNIEFANEHAIKNVSKMELIKNKESIEKKQTYIKVKRILDCILATIALIILSPIYLIIAIAVKIDSKGPVFFKHTRIGKNGKIIKIYKYRTMVENAEELREKGYEIILLNFRNPQMGNCWNPLTLPYSLYKAGNNDKATELLDDLAKNILYDESSKGQDPFWENTSADYFAGLSLALFEDAKEEEINLNTINLMTTIGEEKIGNTTYMKEYFSDKDKSSPAYVNVASTIMAPTETKGSILSVFKQKIKLFSSKENLSEMLSRSDFDMKDIGKKKTAVFIVIHD